MSDEATAIPRSEWRVRFEPAHPPCPHCRMLVIRITTTRYRYYFCEREILTRKQLVRRPADCGDRDS